MTPRLFPVNGKVPAVPAGTSWKDYDGPPPPADQPAVWVIPEGVLDIDGSQGWDSVAEADPPLPYTPVHWNSISGKGAHHVYLAKGEAKNRRVLAGVDVKCAGGYVVVPPAGRKVLERYYDSDFVDPVPGHAPPWAYERNVAKPERPERTSAQAPERKVSSDGWRELPTRTPLEERCERVEQAPEGERHATLNMQAYSHGRPLTPRDALSLAVLGVVGHEVPRDPHLAHDGRRADHPAGVPAVMGHDQNALGELLVNQGLRPILEG